MSSLTPAAVTAIAQQAAESPAPLDPVLVQQVCQEWLEQRATIATLTEIRQKGCDCADEDACRYARERDAALAEATTLRKALIAESAHRSKPGIHSGTEDAWKAAARYADKLEAAEAARDAALAERDALTDELGKTITLNATLIEQLDEARRVLRRCDDIFAHNQWGDKGPLRNALAAVLAQEGGQ